MDPNSNPQPTQSNVQQPQQPYSGQPINNGFNPTPDLSYPPFQPPQKEKRANKTLKIALCIIIPFICIITVLSIILVINSNKNNSNQIDSSDNSQTNISNDQGNSRGIYGKWLTSDETLFSFEPDSFYRWQNKNDLTNNYYKGDIEILVGKDAIDELGVTYEEAQNILEQCKGRLTINDINVIKLYPTYSIMNGTEETDNLEQDLQEEDYMLLIFVMANENEAELYDVNNDNLYHTTRYTE